MKRLALVLILLAGCTRAASVNIPAAKRQANWGREGSCGYACLVTILNNERHVEASAYILRHCGGGATIIDLCHTLDRCGVAYEWTDASDVRLLEDSCRLGRGAVIGLKVYDDAGNPGDHYVTLVYLDATYAGVIDPNFPQHVVYFRRGELLANWSHADCGHGSAISPLH